MDTSHWGGSTDHGLTNRKGHHMNPVAQCIGFYQSVMGADIEYWGSIKIVRNINYALLTVIICSD